MNYSNFAQQVRANLSALEMKVSTADLRRVDYDPRWVYLNRIGKKLRILKASDAIGNGGTIRAALKVTWNPDTYEREQVVRYVQRLMPALRHYAVRGTCHQHRTVIQVAEVLSGAVDQSNPRVWNMVAPGDVTPAMTKAAKLMALGF